MLILYWIGHGAYFHNEESKQMLLLENATADNRVSMDTAKLRNFLQNNFWDNNDCLRRLVFIDSCAEQRRFDNLNPVGTPIKAQKHGHKIGQIKLCEMRSASLGQFAHIGQDGERRSAHFSSALIGWLKRRTQNHLLHDIDDLVRHLEAELTKVREEKKIDQHPVFWEFGDWDGKTKAQFSQSGDEWVTEATKLLRGLNISNEQYRPIYLRLIDGRRAQSCAGGLQAMIDHLHRFETEDGELPPVLEFVARVAKSNLVDEKLSKKLWRLVEAYSTKHQQANFRERLATESRQAQPTHTHLLFDLAASVIEGKFNLTVWRQTAEGQFPQVFAANSVTKAETEEAVSDCIRACKTADLFLEFFLPEKLLSLGVERWDYAGSAIGDQFPVTVRWQERANGSIDPQLLARWEKVSRRIRCSEDSDRKPAARWLPDPKLPLNKVTAHILTEDYGACVAFTVPPETMLRNILSGGAPFAFWPRSSPADPKKFRCALDGKVGDGRLNNLPKGVCDLRRAAINDNDPGSNLTLLWDEPARNPWEGKFTPLD